MMILPRCPGALMLKGGVPGSPLIRSTLNCHMASSRNTLVSLLSWGVNLTKPVSPDRESTWSPMETPPENVAVFHILQVPSVSLLSPRSLGKTWWLAGWIRETLARNLTELSAGLTVSLAHTCGAVFRT